MTDLVYSNQDERYRQARLIFNQKIDYWNEKDKPALFSAFKIFQQLADENYCKAFYPLSRLYECKRDVEEAHNHTQHFAKLAFDWSYANRSNTDAELWNDLGEMYLHGHGVEYNFEKSAFWFCKAAEHGDSEAQYNLSHSYTFGLGVPEDHIAAAKWCQLAADQGHVTAQLNLAYCPADIQQETDGQKSFAEQPITNSIYCSQRKNMNKKANHIFTAQEAAMAYALSAERIFGNDCEFLNANPHVIPIFVSQLFQSLEISIKHAGIESQLFTEDEARNRARRFGHGINELASLAVEKLGGDSFAPILKALTHCNTGTNSKEIIHQMISGKAFEKTRDKYASRCLGYGQVADGEFALIDDITSWIAAVKETASNLPKAIEALKQRKASPSESKHFANWGA